MARKAITLLTFSILMAGFIAFKTGYLDSYFGTADEEGIIHTSHAQILNSLYADTPPPPADTVIFSPEMMSTSKSMIGIDQKILFPISDSSVKIDTSLKPKE